METVLGKIEETDGDVRFVAEFVTMGTDENPINAVQVTGSTPDCYVTRAEDADILRLARWVEPGEDLRVVVIRMWKPDILRTIANERK